MAEFPTIKRKTHSLVIPSLGKRVKYTSLTAGDEVDLSLAKENYTSTVLSIPEDTSKMDEAKIYDKAYDELLSDILEIFGNLFEDEFDMDFITEGDLEIILREVKMNSIDSVSDLTLTCPKCNGEIKRQIELKNLKVKKTEPTKVIKLSDTLKLKIRHIPVNKRHLKATKLSEMELEALSGTLYSIEDTENGTFFFDEKDKEFTIDWFRENLTPETKKEIAEFANDSPGFEPLKIKGVCTNKIDENGNYLSLQDYADLANAKREAIEMNDPDKAIDLKKYKTCGNTIDLKYDSFLHYFF